MTDEHGSYNPAGVYPTPEQVHEAAEKRRIAKELKAKKKEEWKKEAIPMSEHGVYPQGYFPTPEEIRESEEQINRVKMMKKKIKEDAKAEQVKEDDIRHHAWE